MTAASNSEARKRGADLARDLFNTAHENARVARAVEVIARAEFDLTGPWFDHLGNPLSWDAMSLREPSAYAARRAHAAPIVAALQAEGLL